jgi:hypothetical protein
MLIKLANYTGCAWPHATWPHDYVEVCGSSLLPSASNIRTSLLLAKQTVTN